MIDILSLLKEKYEGKYDYLRLGRVDVSTQEKRITVTLLLPEDVFDYSFNTANIKEINDTIKESLNNTFSVYCKVEKIVVTPEIFKGALIEYMEKNFPLIFANTDFSFVSINVTDKIVLNIPVQENVYSYMQMVKFDEKIKKFCSEKFVLSLQINYDLCPDKPVEIKTGTQNVNRYGKSVSVSDKKLIFGKQVNMHGSAMHISTLKGDGEEVLCCGKISNLKFYTRGEDKRVENKRFFAHYYMFSINDTTGYLSVFVNTDTQIPQLADGQDVICRGRVTRREDRGTLSMYAKNIALCKVPYDVIAEQTKPLPAPSEYSILIPQKYEEVVYSQMSLMGDTSGLTIHNDCPPTVVIGMRGAKEEKFVPYEIALIHCEKGEIVDYLHTFLKVSFTEKNEISEYANAKGYSSPRLATTIPDIVKYLEDKIIVTQNPQLVLDTLNNTAKPLRYTITNESKAFAQYNVKVDFSKCCDAFDDAIEMAKVVVSKS